MYLFEGNFHIMKKILVAPNRSFVR